MSDEPNHQHHKHHIFGSHEKHKKLSRNKSETGKRTYEKGESRKHMHLKNRKNKKDSDEEDETFTRMMRNNHRQQDNKDNKDKDIEVKPPPLDKEYIHGEDEPSFDELEKEEEYKGYMIRKNKNDDKYYYKPDDEGYYRNTTKEELIEELNNLDKKGSLKRNKNDTDEKMISKDKIEDINKKIEQMKLIRGDRMKPVHLLYEGKINLYAKNTGLHMSYNELPFQYAAYYTDMIGYIETFIFKERNNQDSLLNVLKNGNLKYNIYLSKAVMHHIFDVYIGIPKTTKIIVLNKDNYNEKKVNVEVFRQNDINMMIFGPLLYKYKTHGPDSLTRQLLVAKSELHDQYENNWTAFNISNILLTVPYARKNFVGEKPFLVNVIRYMTQDELLEFINKMSYITTELNKYKNLIVKIVEKRKMDKTREKIAKTSKIVESKNKKEGFNDREEFDNN